VRRWLAETGGRVARETNRQWRSLVWGKQTVVDGVEWWRNGDWRGGCVGRANNYCGTQMTAIAWKVARRWLMA